MRLRGTGPCPPISAELSKDFYAHAPLDRPGADWSVRCTFCSHTICTPEVNLDLRSIFSTTHVSVQDCCKNSLHARTISISSFLGTTCTRARLIFGAAQRRDGKGQMLRGPSGPRDVSTGPIASCAQLYATGPARSPGSRRARWRHDLPWVEDIARVQGGFDGAHGRDRGRAVLLLQVLLLAHSDAMLATGAPPGCQ